MSGTKDKSGGPRPNAGRPVAKATLRLGQAVMTNAVSPEGVGGIPQQGAITGLTRTQIVITLSDGAKINILR